MSEYDHLFSISRDKKNQEYKRYLDALYDYLYGYLERIKPLLDTEQEFVAAQKDFEKKWTEGTFPGWQVRTQKMHFFSKTIVRLKLFYVSLSHSLSRKKLLVR